MGASASTRRGARAAPWRAPSSIARSARRARRRAVARRRPRQSAAAGAHQHRAARRAARRRRATARAAHRALSPRVAAARAPPDRSSPRPKSAGRELRSAATAPPRSSATRVAPAGANSSSPPAPCTTSARCDAERAAARAPAARTSAASKTPMTLVARAGRVGQRPEQVEDACARRAPGAAPAACRVARVERRARRGSRCPTSREAARDHAPAGAADVDAERLEHVGASRERDDCARLPCLATAHAGAGDDERRERRDVERAARRRRRCRRCRPARGARSARAAHARARIAARRADHLVDGLALHAQRDQQRADLRRRRLAVHDLADDRRHLGARSGPARAIAPRDARASTLHRAASRQREEVAQQLACRRSSGSTRGGTARPRPAASGGARAMISSSAVSRRDLERSRAALARSTTSEW